MRRAFSGLSLLAGVAAGLFGVLLLGLGIFLAALEYYEGAPGPFGGGSFHTHDSSYSIDGEPVSATGLFLGLFGLGAAALVTGVGLVASGLWLWRDRSPARHADESEPRPSGSG